MAQSTLDHGAYRDKVLACWMGKNIGGTLGAPFEWRRQVNSVSFYTQDLRGEPVPNDDLDIQLLWLVALEEKGLDINSRILGEYWCLYLTPHWMEYGTSKANMRAGFPPPLSGAVNNVYRHSCGAFIRSEIWACIAPGLPDVAASYACEDAVLDHGSGEGTYGEIFFAALESAAFLVSDLRELIAIGLSYLPPDCAVSRAVGLVLECHDGGKSWLETRDAVLHAWRGGVPGYIGPASAEDVAKGFGDGIPGFDAPGNAALTILALLEGADDFGKVLCTAVNCGEDTDCTAATAGSIFGLIHGMKGIPQKWIDPIGRSIKTCCLNLGDMPLGKIAPTVDDLTDRTGRLARQLLLRPEHRERMEIAEDRPTDLLRVDTKALRAGGAFLSALRNLDSPRYEFDFFTVWVDYGKSAFLRGGEPKSLRIVLRNTYRMQTQLALRWHLPSGWRVDPSDRGMVFLYSGSEECLVFTFFAEKMLENPGRAVLELTVPGRPTVMLVPIVFFSGDLVPESAVPG